MSETPAWLSGGDENANNVEMTGVAITQPSAAGGGSTTATSTTTTGAANTATSTTTTSAEDEEKLPGVILMMRLANMAVAIALVTCSIFTMIGKIDPTIIVLGVYASCGGLLICCLETQLKFLRVLIAVNFGFLFNSVWRFLFYLLLASITYSYGSLFGIIIACCLVGCALFNTYVLCRYPAYRRIRDKMAEEEDKRLEERISKEVTRQAMNQLRSGA